MFVSLIHLLCSLCSKGYNLVDESRRSTSYERRLLKYAQRGFAITIPGIVYTLTAHSYHLLVLVHVCTDIK
jgi:hypothetical protein